MPRQGVSPHIIDGYSPLETLIARALRLFGDFAPDTAGPGVHLMFTTFANQIVDEVNGHAYHQGEPIDYYTSETETRPIPDHILIDGLLAYYAMQQNSDRSQLYMPKYYRTLNQLLWQQLNGNKPIQLRITDDGTNPKNTNALASDPINGSLRSKREDS